MLFLDVFSQLGASLEDLSTHWTHAASCVVRIDDCHNIESVTFPEIDRRDLVSKLNPKCRLSSELYYRKLSQSMPRIDPANPISA